MLPAIWDGFGNGLAEVLFDGQYDVISKKMTVRNWLTSI